MKKYQYLSVITASAFLLSACVSGGANESSLVAFGQVAKSATGNTEPPRAEDYELSCGEINTRLANLQERFDEIEKERKANARKRGLLSGAVTGALSVFGSRAAINTGTADGIRAVGQATAVTSNYASSLINSESDSDSLKAVTEIVPLADRMRQLHTVRIEKNC